MKILPSSEFIKYLSICLIAFSIWFYFAINVLYKKIILNEIQKLLIASLVGFTPVVAACLFNTGNRYKPINMSMFGNFIHILIGNLFCSVPVTYMCMLALK